MERNWFPYVSVWRRYRHAFRPSQDIEPVPALAVGATKVFFHRDHPFDDDAGFPVSRYRVMGECRGLGQR